MNFDAKKIFKFAINEIKTNPELKTGKVFAPTHFGVTSPNLKPLTKDVFNKGVATDLVGKNAKPHTPYIYNLNTVCKNPTTTATEVPQFAKTISLSRKIFEVPKPQLSHEVAINSAKRVTEDKKLQETLAEFMEKEAIVIRTKSDAKPILKSQFNALPDKENVVVLDINPQINNGMQKSNSLISRWYTEANDIPKENLVTLRPEELRTKAFRPNEFNESWVQGSQVSKKIERLASKVDFAPMEMTRQIIEDSKVMDATELLNKYTIEELAGAMKTINGRIITPQKRQGYVGALNAQLREATKNKDNVTVVIPDDCSLSGSSMLCDSVKIFDRFIKENPSKKIHVVYSPLILSEQAQGVFETFMDKSIPVNNKFLKKINAIKADGSEAYQGIKSAFENVKASDNITFELTPSSMQAKHFTETDYFKNIEDLELKSKLTYLMQGPMENGSALFGGFGNCGTLVITPTEEFAIAGKTYAGKIPTNSVGFMEILGHESGVLNDEIVEGKGLFTKGTGKGYTRYCEWEGLANPETSADRISVQINKDGSVSRKE